MAKANSGESSTAGCADADVAVAVAACLRHVFRISLQSGGVNGFISLPYCLPSPSPSLPPPATDRSSAGPALAASRPSRCPSRSRSRRRSRNRSKAEHQFELRVNIITEIKSGILIKTQLHLQPQTHEQKRGRRGEGGRGSRDSRCSRTARNRQWQTKRRSRHKSKPVRRTAEQQQQQRRNLG